MYRADFIGQGTERTYYLMETNILQIKLSSPVNIKLHKNRAHI